MSNVELKPEQIAAINHGEGNILVSASAGSGKTFVMIERLIKLIGSGRAQIDEVLAVTFTEAAASDMRLKLKKALTTEIKKGRSELSDQLTGVQTSDICTLHALCSRIIRKYFYAADVSQNFRIADDVQSASYKAECIDETFAELYESGDEDFLRLRRRYSHKRKDDEFKKILLSIYDYCNSFADPAAAAEKALFYYTDDGANYVSEEYKKTIDSTLKIYKKRLADISAEFSAKGLTKSVGLVDLLIGDVDALLSADVYAVKDLQPDGTRFDFDRKLDEDAAELKKEVVEMRKDVKATFAKIGDVFTDAKADLKTASETAETTRGLIKVLNLFTDKYAKKKREENQLDFDDLEHFTLKILEDASVREELKNKYKYIFVDEYQDVNDVQEEIINRLADDNVFMVGDLKQSIYGFRGCRPEFFEQKQKEMEANGEKTLSLNCNFRSADEVINGVNEIFDYCMTEDGFGVNYARDARLVPGGVYGDEYRGRSCLHFLKKDKKTKTEKETPRVYDVLSAIGKNESTVPAVASLIAQIIDEERGKSYYDVKDGKFKRINFSDVAVLTRNKKGDYVRGLVEGLSAVGIPVTSDVKQNVCDFPEVKAVINALRFIDGTCEDIPLAATLKSPFGGFSEEDLAEIVLFYRDAGMQGSFCDSYEYYLTNGVGELNDKLKKFDDYFSNLRFVSDFIGAGEVLGILFGDSGYEDCLYASEKGADKVNRVRRFVSECFAIDKNLTVREVLRLVDECRDAFVLSVGEEDCVKVSTMHSSKGLEYPVTIVCGLEKSFNTDDEKKAVFFDRDFGFAVRTYDDEEKSYSSTPLRALIKERMKIATEKEEMRLFYVALTRAKYSLHMIFEKETDDRKNFYRGASCCLDYIPKSVEVVIHTADEYGAVGREQKRRGVVLCKTDANKTAELKNRLDFLYPHLSDCKLPLKCTVTSAVAKGEEDYKVKQMFPPNSTDTEKGTAAHKFLEGYDFANMPSAQADAKRQVLQGLITEAETASIDLSRIDRALKSKALSSLRNKKLYRERSFLCAVPASAIAEYDSTEEVVLQGVIDLMAEDADGITIVDYKYSVLDAASLEKKYRKQLDLYATAAEKITGKKVNAKILVNIFTGETINW